MGLILVSQLALGCSTMNKTVLTSVGVGAVAGGAIGHNTSGGGNKRRAIGALTGALVSGVIGYFVYKNIENREEKIRRETLFNLDKYDVSTSSTLESSSVHKMNAPSIEIGGKKVWLVTDDVKWNSGQKNK